MNFQVSDKVVCVEEFTDPPEPNYANPELNVVYVVREVRLFPYESILKEGSLLLVGICGGFLNGQEYSFWAKRFRKLSDLKAENAAIALMKNAGCKNIRIESI